jgi:two-component system nitrate/nitrite response regulator NarL
VRQPARAAGSGIKVALVSSYPTVRAGLRAFLTPDPTIDVFAEASTLADLLAEAPAAADVVVVDLEPAQPWEFLAESADLPQETGLVLIGPDTADVNTLEALDGRAWAYLLRDAGASELTSAVAAVAAGLVVVEAPLVRRLWRPIAAIALDDGSQESLTARESEVLQLVAQGLPNKLIALRLGISEHTVKFHVTSILGKLGASSRTEAVRLGARRGLVVL